MATQNRESGARTILVFAAVIVLLLVLIYLAWRAYAHRQAQGPATAPAGELYSEDRSVYGGLPRAPADVPVKVLRNVGYVVGYSEQRKNPLWVCYRVFDVPPGSSIHRPATPFVPDDRTTSRVRDIDYRGSGFDRGHMAPSHAIGKCYGAEAQVGTFIFSNVCPQRPVLNQKVWESLEHLEADVYPRRYKEVWVIDGPIFGESPRTIGVSRVPVPDAFYKILLRQDASGPTTMQVIMPQDVVEADRRELSKFVVTIQKIQERSRLEFYPNLPASQREKVIVGQTGMW